TTSARSRVRSLLGGASARAPSWAAAGPQRAPAKRRADMAWIGFMGLPANGIKEEGASPPPRQGTGVLVERRDASALAEGLRGVFPADLQGLRRDEGTERGRLVHDIEARPRGRSNADDVGTRGCRGQDGCGDEDDGENGSLHDHDLAPILGERRGGVKAGPAAPGARL